LFGFQNGKEKEVGKMTRKIAVIDDDVQIVALIRRILERENYQVVTHTNASHISLTDIAAYDLILLDIMMPEVSGIDFLKQIRDKTACPILFLTAKSTEEDKVAGLLEGADDYITKPFGRKELIARIQAHLRRESREQVSKRLYLENGITIDFDAQKILVKNIELKLTSSEYKICEHLVKNRKRVFSKEEIYDHLYYDNWDTNAQIRTITEFISATRKKFSEHGVDSIKTIWGVGYQWE
jgi:DNA-binding response OmpR family regulator